MLHDHTHLPVHSHQCYSTFDQHHFHEMMRSQDCYHHDCICNISDILDDIFIQIVSPSCTHWLTAYRISFLKIETKIFTHLQVILINIINIYCCIFLRLLHIPSEKQLIITSQIERLPEHILCLSVWRCNTVIIAIYISIHLVAKTSFHFSPC